jgi:hypothetical protein
MIRTDNIIITSFNIELKPSLNKSNSKTSAQVRGHIRTILGKIGGGEESRAMT